MRTPRAMELLDAWERGISRRPVERSLVLLAIAYGDREGADLANICVGSRNERLLALREALFGSRFEVTTSCPVCGEALEMSFHAAQMRAAWPSSPPSVGMRMTVNKARCCVVFRAATNADLIALANDPQRIPTGRALLARCVVEASIGDACAQVDDLPEFVLDAIERAMAQADPQADMGLALACPVCAYAWNAPFDIARFLWTEVHAWARRTLREVHALAQAYGWREREVLELSPLRRQAYLELARI